MKRSAAEWIEITLIAAALIFALAVMAALIAAPGQAHEWYARRSDPVFNNGCCGGNDCNEFKGGLIEAEAGGYRIRLTLEQAREVNKLASKPVDALVPWSRIQESEDGNYHLCIFNIDRDPPRNGVICLFAPPQF